MNTAARTLQDYFADPRHAATLKFGSGGLALALLAALLWVAWAQGGTRLDTPMGQALAGSGVAALATALGALPALFIRKISARWEDVMLGFGAGVMAAAACFSLILPGVAAAPTFSAANRQAPPSSPWGWCWARCSCCWPTRRCRTSIPAPAATAPTGCICAACG